MVEKTIWMLWLQGWENAPDLVKACKASWTRHNANWTIHFLRAETLGEHISASAEFDTLRERAPVILSDIIRNELLSRHGGIWADATTYCLRPLDEWIELATSSGFFAFNRPEPGIPPPRMLSNWFLAADKESYIPKTWLKQTYAYWKHRSERDQYYWHHQLFADAYGQDAEFRRIWDATPKLSAEGPLCFVPSRETLFKPVNDFHRLIVETAQTPMLKLTHKLDHSLGEPGTAYRWLCDRVGV